MWRRREGTVGVVLPLTSTEIGLKQISFYANLKLEKNSSGNV